MDNTKNVYEDLSYESKAVFLSLKLAIAQLEERAGLSNFVYEAEKVLPIIASLVQLAQSTNKKAYEAYLEYIMPSNKHENILL